MPEIYISIGSNINRQRNIQLAVNLLAANFSGIKCSSIYESEAMGFDGDAFYNLVVKTTTGESLKTVLQILKKIELDCGRGDDSNKPEKKFSPRTIDLDLLLFGNKIFHDEHIDIPRMDITEYAFVLLPLSELAPDLLHPELKIRLADLWQGFTGARNNLKYVSFQPMPESS